MYGYREKHLKRAARRSKYGKGHQQKRAPYSGGIRDTYRKLYPKYIDAPHLAPLYDLFDRAKRERVYAIVTYPPRAGKTETLIAGIVDRLRFNPEARIGFAGYSGLFANKKSWKARNLAQQHGVPIANDSRAKNNWRTGVGEGGLWATSAGGSITGEGFELMICDDLMKGREDAESATIRDKAYDWFKQDVMSRLEPEGSIIVCGTRWHADDPIGRLKEEGRFEEILIPALNEDEQSYWPDRWPDQALHRLRTEMGGADGYGWSSLYQGNPRAPGDAVFTDATYYTTLLGDSPRVIIGVDFAYTVNKSSDYSCAVAVGEKDGCYYVLDVIREKVKEAEFREHVAAMVKRWNAQGVTGYVARTEQANIDLLARDGLPAWGRPASEDKKTRALPTAAAWNLGRVQVRQGAHWTSNFVNEVLGFTGADLHDDQVDALAAAYDALYSGGTIDWDFCDQLIETAPQPFSMALN